MSTAVGDLEKLPHVLSAQNPLSTPSATGQSGPDVGPLSSDGKTGYITVRFDVQPSTLGDGYLHGVDDAVRPLRQAGAQVEYGGPLGELARPAPDDRVSELIGFGVAIVVLLIGFGSVLAAGIPLLTALISVVGGLAALGLLAAAFTLAGPGGQRPHRRHRRTAADGAGGHDPAGPARVVDAAVAGPDHAPHRRGGTGGGPGPLPVVTDTADGAPGTEHRGRTRRQDPRGVLPPCTSCR